jgi:hypothetical protein
MNPRRIQKFRERSKKSFGNVIFGNETTLQRGISGIAAVVRACAQMRHYPLGS